VENVAVVLAAAIIEVITTPAQFAHTPPEFDLTPLSTLLGTVMHSFMHSSIGLSESQTLQRVLLAAWS
jgi:hypothetical protein